MKGKKLILIPGFVISVFLFIADIPYVLTRAFSAGRATISVVSDNKREYRFLNFSLTPGNIVLNLKSESQLFPDFLSFFLKKGGNNSNFLSNGSFVIFVPRKRFPIPSMNYTEYISVVMPATDINNPDRDKLIAEKKALFDSIVNMVNSGIGEIDVVIDLNRCVLVKDNDPSLLKIDGALVYLRDVNGRYINHSGLSH